MEKRKLKEILVNISVKLDFLISRQGVNATKKNALGANTTVFVSGEDQFRDYIKARIAGQNKQKKDGKPKS